MAKIKLKQLRGEFSWNGMLFVAGREYEVNDQTAYYLVNFARVAEEVVGISPLKGTPSFFAKKGALRIALVRIGGIGDSLVLASFATAIKRKWKGCQTTLYIRDSGGHDIIKDNPSVDRSIIVGNVVWVEYMKKIYSQGFDMVYDNRYITKVFYREKAKYLKDVEITEKRFAPYLSVFNKFPLSCPKVTEIADNMGKNETEIMRYFANLDGTDDDLYIKLYDEDFAMVKLLENDKYVTVHNGADITRQTKCWDKRYWESVASYLNTKGYKVLQLGMKFEEHIKGTVNMTGKTTLRQAAGLITHAKFHVDTEGGLVHIARAVRTRCVVIFGPTPPSFFGYDTNVNINSPTECRGCWWTSDFWWRECPKKYPLPPKCMTELTAQMVIDGIKKVEKMKELTKVVADSTRIDMSDGNEQFAVEMPLTDAHYKSEAWQLDRVNTMMELAKGKKILEVGAGDGYCVRIMKKRGFDVTATEISKIRLDRMRKVGIDAIYADINKLPFDDDSFDTVICGEVLEHIDSMAIGLSELERVCRPDGRIVVSLPVDPEHRKFKLHKWGIEHHSVLKQGKLNMVVLGLERINR